MKFKQWLNESMSVYVADRPYHNDLNDIDDLANYLKRKVFYIPIEPKLSPEQFEKIRDGGAWSHHIIAPDGKYYTDGTQVINFYTTGLEEFLPQMIKGIKYYLDELGVKYGPFKEDKSGMFKGNVIRIPILQFDADKNTPPLLNLSNQNAIEIFANLLKFPFKDGEFPNIPVGELYRRIESLEKFDLQLHARDPFMSKRKGGATFYNSGQSYDDIKRKLEQIKKIAEWAIKNHYNEIKVI